MTAQDFLVKISKKMANYFVDNFAQLILTLLCTQEKFNSR